MIIDVENELGAENCCVSVLSAPRLHSAATIATGIIAGKSRALAVGLGTVEAVCSPLMIDCTVLSNDRSHFRKVDIVVVKGGRG
jgi:hypothetical protein